MCSLINVCRGIVSPLQITKRQKMTNCTCDSQKKYVLCCEQYITKKQLPESPEALMRSRYSAYSMANIDYIKDTMRDNALIGFDEMKAKRWANRVNWIKLEVLNSGNDHLNRAYVEFEASFVEGSRLKHLHEKSYFTREQGQWFYVDGTHLTPSCPEQKISLNTICPCGSKRKYKNCHARNY